MRGIDTKLVPRSYPHASSGAFVLYNEEMVDQPSSHVLGGEDSKSFHKKVPQLLTKLHSVACKRAFFTIR